MFTDTPPLNDDVVDAMEKKPTILVRNSLIKKVRDSISKFINIFIEGI